VRKHLDGFLLCSKLDPFQRHPSDSPGLPVASRADDAHLSGFGGYVAGWEP